MRLQAVLIPARRFEVEVLLGPHDGLSLVEQYILRSVALGARTIDSVAKTLGVPERIILDAIVDLLSRGLVDVSNGGALAAVERVSAAMGDPSAPTSDWFLAFQSARLHEPRTVSLVQDLVAGEVFSLSRVPLDRERLPMMPMNQNIRAIDELPLGTLVSAVMNAMRKARRSADTASRDDLRDEPLPKDARILGVRLARTAGGLGTSGTVAARGMSILAQVAVTSRGTDDPPRVAIVEPLGVPSHVRRSISSTLDDLWARDLGRGDGQFFARVETHTDSWDDEQVPRFASPEPMLERIASLIDSTSEDWTERHRELANLERQLRDTGEQLATFRATAQFVAGAPGVFRKAALDALGSANEQVILACPWIGQLGRDPEWIDAIRDAIERGVKVILVWGIKAGATHDDDPAWRALTKLALERPQGLVFAERGAGSHAKLIVRDASWALVTSCNYLNASADRRRRDVGAELRSVDGTVPLALQSVLSWARQLIPDHSLRERCVDSPVLFGLRESRPDLPLVVESISLPNLLFGNVGIETWKRTWRARLVELGGLTTGPCSAVVPIFDAQHRDVLLHAIEQSRTRVLIESHRVSGFGLTRPVVDALVAACRRNVQVVVRHGIDEAPEPETLANLAELRRVGASVAAVDTHAKLLVHDDWCAVSSFNFLSADPGFRGSRELGVHVNDPKFVAAAWESSVE